MSSRRSFRIAAFACVAGLGAVACGGSGGDDAQDVASPPATATPVDDATASADGAVPAALQFTAPLIGGGEIDASELAGQPTALWFWAPT